MPRGTLYRVAGWCALACVLLYVAAAVSLGSGANAAGVFLEYSSFLPLAFIFYAFTIVYRAESRRLSLAGLIVLFLAIGADVVANTHYGVTFLSSLWYLLFALPFLIFGILGYRTAWMPRGAAVVALLTGATEALAAIAGFTGNPAMADNVSSVSLLLMLVWLVWLWRIFWSKLPAAP